MRRKAKIVLIAILCLPIVFQMIWEISPPMWRIESKIKHVWFEPEGFVSLEELEDKYGDILFWHTFDGAAFYWEDLDGRAFGQRLLGDKSFLVIYRGD